MRVNPPSQPPEPQRVLAVSIDRSRGCWSPSPSCVVKRRVLPFPAQPNPGRWLPRALPDESWYRPLTSSEGMFGCFPMGGGPFLSALAVSHGSWFRPRGCRHRSTRKAVIWVMLKLLRDRVGVSSKRPLRKTAMPAVVPTMRTPSGVSITGSTSLVGKPWRTVYRADHLAVSLTGSTRRRCLSTRCHRGSGKPCWRDPGQGPAVHHN